MKKIISLSLVVMMLISLFVPSGAVFAQDTAKEITGKVTISDPSIELLNNEGIVERSLLDGEGRLADNPTKLSGGRRLTFSYTWNVADTTGINSGDYFTVQLPGLSLLQAVVSADDKFPVTSGDKTFGYFMVDLSKNILKVYLNEEAVKTPEINNGKLKITLRATKNVVIETDPQNSKVTATNLVVKEGQQTITIKGGTPYVHGSNFSKSGTSGNSGGINWTLVVNRKDQIAYLNSENFEEKRNVWVEDRLASDEMKVIEDIRFYPTAYVATEDGKMSTNTFYGPNTKVKIRKLTEDVANYNDFKSKVEALTDIVPFTAFVYKANPTIAGDTDGVLIYVGNLTAADALRYDEIFDNYREQFLFYLQDELNKGQINQTQYDNTIKMYFVDPVAKQEMKKIMGGDFMIPTKQPYGGRFNNTAEMRYDNNKLVSKPTSALDLSASGEADGVVLTSVTVKKTWDAPLNKQVPVTIELLKDGVKFKTVKLGVENPKPATENEIEVSGWDYTFTKLKVQNQQPKYTVKELQMDGYTSQLTSVENVHTFHNTYIAPKTVVFKAKKEWVGPANGDVQVSLYGKDKNVALQTLTIPANQDTVTFAEVDEFDGAEKINYTVVETGRPANSEQIGDVAFEDATKTFVVKNRNTEKVEASITKKWIGQAKDELVVYLTINGVRSKNESHKLHLASNAHKDYNWRATISELPKYDENGDPIAYSFEEELPNGYSQKPLEQNGYNVVITNVNNKEIDINVTKEWKNSSVEKVTVRLHATRTKGADAGTKEVGVAELSAANNWTHKFANNRAYDQETGEEIVYSVTEDKVPNFATEIKGNQKDGFTVVNTYLPPIPPYVPEVPAEPSEPTKPTPETPTEPTKPAPEVPTNPGTPTDVLPEDPTPQGDPNVKPTEPTKPQDPSVPETVLPENPIPQGNKELPKTDGIPAAAILLLGAGLAGLGAFFKKEK